MKNFALLLFFAGCRLHTVEGTVNEQTCSAEECVKVALEFESGAKTNLVKAAAAYHRGCKLGNPHACGSLGMMRFYGHGIQSDPLLAISELTKSCEDDYGQACANLGIIYALGRSGTVDKSKAKHMFEKGCRLQSATACEALKEL